MVVKDITNSWHKGEKKGPIGQHGTSLTHDKARSKGPMSWPSLINFITLLIYKFNRELVLLLIIL